MPVARTSGQPSTGPTRRIIPGIALANDNDFERGEAQVSETYSTTVSDQIHGDGLHSSMSSRTERAVADPPPGHANLGQHDSPSYYLTSEWDDTTDYEQAGHRVLEDRDPGGTSQPPGEAQSSKQNSGAFWLPFCLRRTTSLLFMVGFALKAALLEILFVVSQRSAGLSPGMPFMRYMWSYGTTGILTLTAALWHRLDYETRISAPWLRSYPITTSKAALLVDYIDTWSLLIPFRGLRNGDNEVVYSSTISLLLQVLIILSTSLFTLVPTNIVNHAEPVFLTSRFVDDPARLKDSESLLPYYITTGTKISRGNLSDIMNSNSTHPEGCTDQFAYQTFYPVSSSLEDLETTVNGVALGLACETASVGNRIKMPQFDLSQPSGYSVEGGGPYFEVNYQGCQTTIEWDVISILADQDVWLQDNKTFRGHGMMLRGIPGFARNKCNSTDQEAHRVVFLSAEVEWRSYNQTIILGGQETTGLHFDTTVLQAIALVCTPSLEQTLLDVSRNSGGVQSVKRHNGNLTNFLSVIHPWDFIDFFFDRTIIPQIMDDVILGNTTIMADVHSQAVLGICGQSCLEVPRLLNDTAFLQNILATFLAKYAATTAHTMLTERANVTSTGISSGIVVRLWVQPIMCQVMVALLAFIILIILGFQLERKKKLTRMINPGSIAAATILAGQAASFKFPKHLGSATMEELDKALDGLLDGHGSSSSYPSQHSPNMVERNRSRTSTEARPASSRTPVFQNPLPLRLVSQAALILIIIGCGTTLMVLLRKSADEQGLGNTPNSRYLLFAWTTVPATILTVISWWLSSIDTQVRLLAPYHSLKRNKCSRSVLRMDLLRGLMPFVLYQELISTNFAAASTTLAALLGATLTTVSAPMFHVITYPVSSPVKLSQNTVFMTPTAKPNVVINDTGRAWEERPSYIETSRLSSFILETNLSYSQGSYQDLVFPTFSMATLETGNALHTTNSSSATIKVTAPALRPRLDCRTYSPSDIAASYVRDQRPPWKFGSFDLFNGVVVNITTELCHSDWSDLWGYATAAFETGNLSESLFAAATTNQGETALISGCSGMLYVWGYYDASIGPITNISAVGCNSSVELVDATFSLSWPDLSLDLVDVPEAIESTVRPINGHGAIDSFFSHDLYSGLASLPVAKSSAFDSFFRQLVTSKYAIPISAIGDPSQADVVIDAIRLHHGIIEAQFLSSNYRIGINSSNVTDNGTAVLGPSLFNDSTSGESARYSATMVFPFGSHRVVQDSTATAVLEALLLSILILLIMGWVFGPRKPALPRSPSSVGSILALLAGGNILEHIYDGSPEPLSWDDVKRRLGEETQLYLGWDPSTTNEEFEHRRFGIWIIRQVRGSTSCPLPATAPEGRTPI